MAEWLTHVLLAYAIFTVLSWRISWLDQRWVAIAMIGSLLPDLNRIELFIEADAIAYLLGVPFSWGGLHTIPGVVLLAAIGALLFSTPTHQRRAFLTLLGGAISHLIIDLPQQYADGRMLTNLYLYPLTSFRPPTPGWYVSADRWVLLVALVFALVVLAMDRRRQHRDN